MVIPSFIWIGDFGLGLLPANEGNMLVELCWFEIFASVPAIRCVCESTFSSDT